MTTKTQAPPDLQSQLLEQAMLEARPVLRTWYTDDVLRTSLDDEITRDLAAKADDGVQLIHLGDGRWITLNIPLGHEVDSPRKVFIRHRNFAVNSPDELHQLIAAVREAIAPLAPKRILVFFHGNPFPELAADHVVAGLIHELHLPADAAKPANMRLESPTSMDFYEQYREWYEEFWQRRPHLKHDVRIESREDIAICLEHSGVRLVYLNGELAAMLAAHRRTEFGLTGWRMRERVTAPHSWGKGISTAALVAFAHSLEHDAHDALWGNIVPANQSSLNSALRIGRRIIATMV